MVRGIWFQICGAAEKKGTQITNAAPLTACAMLLRANQSLVLCH